jgi:hypothetical protein
MGSLNVYILRFRLGFQFHVQVNNDADTKLFRFRFLVVGKPHLGSTNGVIG